MLDLLPGDGQIGLGERLGSALPLGRMLKKLGGKVTQRRSECVIPPCLVELGEVNKLVFGIRRRGPELEPFNVPKSQGFAGDKTSHLCPGRADRGEEVGILQSIRPEHEAPSQGERKKIDPQNEAGEPVEPGVTRPQVGPYHRERQEYDRRRGDKDEHPVAKAEADG